MLHFNQDWCIAGGSKSSQPIPDSHTRCNNALIRTIRGRQRFWLYLRREFVSSCCRFIVKGRPSDENGLGEHSTLSQESLCTRQFQGCDAPTEYLDVLAYCDAQSPLFHLRRKKKKKKKRASRAADVHIGALRQNWHQRDNRKLSSNYGSSLWEF